MENVPQGTEKTRRASAERLAELSCDEQVLAATAETLLASGVLDEEGGNE